jgi:DNA invertase Pin-like site-specific DNA recombinase
VRQLTKAGCKKVFREVASGAKTDRAQLRRLLDQLEAGDVVTVTRLDRLARSTRDLLNTLATITAKEAGFRSLGDTWADTTTGEGARREDGPQAEAHPAPAEGSAAAARQRRAGARDRAQLQRPSRDDFKVDGLTPIIGQGRSKTTSIICARKRRP